MLGQPYCFAPIFLFFTLYVPKSLEEIYCTFLIISASGVPQTLPGFRPWTPLPSSDRFLYYSLTHIFISTPMMLTQVQNTSPASVSTRTKTTTKNIHHMMSYLCLLHSQPRIIVFSLGILTFNYCPILFLYIHCE